MSASALPKPERVNQVWLDEAIEAHDAYLRAIPGGMRLFLSFKDGRHLDFSGQNLASAEFVAAELSNAVLVRTCLARSNLFGANLNNADMRECDLTGADLRGVSLTGANLECANLQEADIRNGFILYRTKDGNLTPMRDGAAEISDVNLSGANLMAGSGRPPCWCRSARRATGGHSVSGNGRGRTRPKRARKSYAGRTRPKRARKSYAGRKWPRVAMPARGSRGSKLAGTG